MVGWMGIIRAYNPWVDGRVGIIYVITVPGR
jgi:hypothetical protein